MPAVQHLLRGVPGTLSVTYENAEGAAADPGVVTVTVTRADGTVLVSGVNATGTGATPRTYGLLAAQAGQLDVLTVSWSSPTLGTLTTTVEIVGALLYTVGEARAFHDGAMSDATKYPASRIEQARVRILDAFEEICQVAFVPRYRRERLSGSGTNRLILPTKRVSAVRAVETRSGAIWTAFGPADVADLLIEPWGQVTRESLGLFPAGERNVRVAWEHGYSQPPDEIRRAALIVTRYQLVESNIHDRATAMSVEGGTFSLATAGMRGAWYGLPFVDSVLQRYSERLPGVG
jgi:hypothetical protein